MANPKIFIRRSATPNKVPTSDQLALGELAINTNDGKLYLEKDPNGVGIGTTVVCVNPFNVGVGSLSYDINFTAGDVGIGTDDVSTAVGTNNTAVLAAGIVTAYKFYGDGSALTGIGGGGGAASVTMSTSAPGSPSSGDLWWDTDIGELYVYYEDVDSNQWVETSGGSETVTISDDAPSSPNGGDLWWESDTGRLKIYYNDGDSAQWIDANGGLLSGFSTSIISANTINVSGVSTFTGDITADSNVTVGSGPASGAGSKLWSTGFIELRNDTATVNVIRLFSGGYSNSSETFGVSKDGAVTADGGAGFGGRVNVAGQITTSDAAQIIFAAGQSNQVTFGNEGQATFAGTITANGTVLTSDQRFKENITPANPQLADIEALGAQIKNFDWNADAPSSNGTRQLGLIAQEVEKVCPGIVKTIARTKQGAELTPETTDEEGNVTPATYEEVDDSFKGISHDALIMKLLGAVAELSAKVEALEAG